jgi:pimeloyl-ACP methyl ester carboxylesterase
MAQDLNLVIESVQCRPVILLGHSIGGMILLTYCRLFPHKLGTDVQGLVVAQSTYTNPVKTTKWAGLMTALQKPLLEPLCHLMILLSPVFWIMNWLAYFNGSAHRSTERSSFSGRETRQQLDFLTWEFCKAKPAHAARGFLAMFRYDATDVMPVVPIPSLVVAGDNDQTCLPTASALMAQIIPGAKLVTLPNSQHCGLFEHHQTFHAAVKEFVDALVPDRHRVTRISVPVGNLERPAQYKAGSA